MNGGIRIAGLLSGLLLYACAPGPDESARLRAESAKTEDSLAQCYLFASQEDFPKQSRECRTFLEKDEECAFFPEEKPGCLVFINAVGYTEQQLQCREFAHQEKDCKQLVKERFTWNIRDVFNSLRAGKWDRQPWFERIRAQPLPPVLLGVVRSGYGGKRTFVQGVELGLKRINQKGGVLGRQLAITLEESQQNLERSRAIAEKMRDNHKIRAVIGRQFSVNTIPVTYVYDTGNIVYIAISAIKRDVIRYGQRFIFRLLPNSDDFSEALVNFCVRRDYRKVALLYGRDSYNEELAYAFRDYAISQGLAIVYEKSFFEHRQQFADISADLIEFEIDAIFLTALGDTAARAVQDIRDMGVTLPIVGSDALDSDSFAESVGDAGNGIVVPTIYNPYSKHEENSAFVDAFRRAYGHTPDTWAAQGYDAVNLLAYVMTQEAASTMPAKVATGLRYMPPQTGATGRLAFEKSGELAEKPIYFKELQHEQFVLFKDTKQEAEQTQQIEIIDDRIILRPEKPSESTEAMSVF